MIKLKKLLKIVSVSIALFFSLTSYASEKVTTIFMAGDSTMSIKEVKDYPETGWGMPFEVFFNENVRVVNLAKNGRSTRTFIEEGLWQKINDNIKPGDFVIIQFGHNDESEKKVDRYTNPKQYKANLTRYIEETRSKGGRPILLSSITRRYFADNGKIELTHPHYNHCLEVASKTKVDFIDMDLITRQYFETMGDEKSSLRFMHIKPGVHPNYPNGIRDNTHTNELGAREIAQIVLSELKKMNHPLAEMLREPDPKHLTYKY